MNSTLAVPDLSRVQAEDAISKGVEVTEAPNHAAAAVSAEASPLRLDAVVRGQR